jgi:hypothetical protein
MKQLTFFVFIVLLSFNAKAQNKHFVEIVAGGGHTQMKYLSQFFFTNADRRNTFLFGNRTGFHYGLYINKSIALKTGIRLMSIGEKNVVTNVTWKSEYDIHGNWKSDPALPHEVYETNQEYWLEIPLIFNREFKKKKWTMYYELSLSPTIFCISNSFFILGNKKTPFKIVGALKKFGISVGTAFGVNYTFKNNKKIFIQPSFSTHFTETKTALSNGTLRRFSYLLGIEMGIQFPL